jgi:5'-nucleotidase
MRILLSNDDSVHAEGIKVLAGALRKFADVVVVAPLEEKSTTGHSLTLHKPLRLIKMSDGFYGVSGSPADCVNVGISEVFKGKKPDFVVSGINRGANLGQDVYYSGTVSAAREATFLGIPSLAVSLGVDFKKRKSEKELNYAAAASITLKVLKALLKDKGAPALPHRTLLNLNVPDLPLKKIKGVHLARQGFRHYNGKIIKRTDHRGKDYFWVGGEYIGFENVEFTDCKIVEDGYASLTPLTLDTTCYSFLTELQDHWGKRVVIK